MSMVKMRIRDKIIGLLVLYFLIALAAIGSTLIVSWRLEGGATAINNAGRERMRSYRIAYLLEKMVQQPTEQLRVDINHEIALFEKTLDELEQSDHERTLLLSEDINVKSQIVKLHKIWHKNIKPHIFSILNTPELVGQQNQLSTYGPKLEDFVSDINELVTKLEYQNVRATNFLRILQIALVSLALVGTLALIYMFSHMVIKPVMLLREGIQRMAVADFEVRLPINSRDEFGDLAVGFNRMAKQLQDIYATLERRVEEKSHSIEVKNRELAALDKEKAISDERNLLAQELHDSIAQSLAFLNIQVQLLQEDLQSERMAEAMKTLVQIREGVQQSYDDVRELLVYFRIRIGNTNLETAISAALEKFEGQTGISCTFKSLGRTPELQPEYVLQIMHIVQETLSNIRKHANASHVEVELACNDCYVIDIRDDGIGFDQTKDSGDNHIGLSVMRERGYRIGAKLMINSLPDSGTHICLILPKQLGKGVDL
jgi:nitrate/nitrite-specific signal transduction histidine kinase